jgi:hypothetical protein
VHSVIKLIYENLGKTGVLGIFGGVGVIMLGFGAFKIARRPRDEQAA